MNIIGISVGDNHAKHRRLRAGAVQCIKGRGTAAVLPGATGSDPVSLMGVPIGQQGADKRTGGGAGELITGTIHPLLSEYLHGIRASGGFNRPASDVYVVSIGGGDVHPAPGSFQDCDYDVRAPVEIAVGDSGRWSPGYRGRGTGGDRGSGAEIGVIRRGNGDHRRYPAGAGDSRRLPTDRGCRGLGQSGPFDTDGGAFG